MITKGTAIIKAVPFLRWRFVLEAFSKRSFSLLHA